MIYNSGPFLELKDTRVLQLSDFIKVNSQVLESKLCLAHKIFYLGFPRPKSMIKHCAFSDNGVLSILFEVKSNLVRQNVHLSIDEILENFIIRSTLDIISICAFDHINQNLLSLLRRFTSSHS